MNLIYRDFVLKVIHFLNNDLYFGMAKNESDGEEVTFFFSGWINLEEAFKDAINWYLHLHDEV